MTADDPTASEVPRRIRVNPLVFYGSAACILALVLWSAVASEGANRTISILVALISEWFGWFYILIAALFVGFCLFMAFSRFGNIKLGPDDSKPDFNMFTWASMLFAAGIGTDLMFFSVAEPIYQYLQPPVGAGETVEAARQATVWMLFHYGTTGWAMYALMGVSLGYFAYRRGLPLSVRSSLYPLFGRHIFGPLGHAVDLAAVLGTIFGIATSLGISVVQLNVGLDMLFGIPEGLAAQIALIVTTVVVATLSAVSGVGRGIRRLSEANVILALLLGAFILIAGETVFLLNAFVLNINDYLSRFLSMTMQTFAFDQANEWLNSWTLFFWAWWIAWASFVGLFLARISRGRTIREFILGTLVIPFLYVLMWASIFGNAAIEIVRSGHADFGALTVTHPERGFYTLLTYFPAFPLVAFVATLCGLLFYITSADSGALVMGNLTSRLKRPHDDCSIPVRIFWSVTTGLLTLAMLVIGGIETLQDATIVMALPFAFVMVLLMIGLYKALHADVLALDGVQRSWPFLLSARIGRGSTSAAVVPAWRDRLSRMLGTPDQDAAHRFLEAHVLPALQEISDSMTANGYNSQVFDHSADETDPYVELKVHIRSAEPFTYRVALEMANELDLINPGKSRGVYSRLNVILRNGGQDYDVMGFSKEQLLHDVLDQYQRHHEYLRLLLGS